MNQFGVAAINAAHILQSTSATTPEAAWDQAMSTTSLASSTQNKVCPKEAFLGLVEIGLVAGIVGQQKATIGWNGIYAIIAAHLLRASNVVISQRTSKAPTEPDLWNMVVTPLGRPLISHNSQMSVVLALWIQGLI